MSVHVRRGGYGLEVERDDSERRGLDDEATLVEAEFLADSLGVQERRAQADAANARQGQCRNCEQRCLPAAVYCDEDCRDDYEKRQTAERRTGAGAWGRGGYSG